MSGTTLGMLLFAFGGLAGAMNLVPSKGVRGWAYETWWLVYITIGLIVCPPIICAFTVPHAFEVIASAPWHVVVRSVGFGMMWGVGALSWGLMIRYLGFGLGQTLGCGLCAALGVLLPPLFKGEAAMLVDSPGALVVLSGVVGSLVGIVVVGLAGKSKEDELPMEKKKNFIADFNFKKGLLMTLLAGVFSAGMNYGLQGADVVEKAAVAGGASDTWRGMPVVMMVLWGGYVVEASWCLFHNWRNRTFGDYLKFSLRNYVCCASIGGIWVMQFVGQKCGEPMLGELKYISFGVVMASRVFFSTFLGIFLGEWKGTSCRTRRMLAVGTILLLASFAVMTLGAKSQKNGPRSSVSAYDGSSSCCETFSSSSRETPYSFRQRLTTVHRHDRRDFSRKAKPDDFEFLNGVRIGIAADAPDLVRLAVDDFCDYLCVSMSVNASPSVSSDAQVRISIDPSLKRGYSIVTGKDGMFISAADAKMAAQALYHLEDVMNMRKGPFVKTGTDRRSPIFDHRITFSGYGNDIFPDGHLSQLAHYGFTGIEVWLKDYDVIAQGFRQDVNDLIDRANRYGLDVYLSPRNRAYVHPDDPKAYEMYEKAYGRMVSYYPKATGIKFVGEVCEFPSKDPRCNGGNHLKRKPEDTAKGLPYPGWFPCSDWADWAKKVSGIIEKRNPKCKFVLSTYNWGSQDEKARADLVERLPENTVLIPVFEMFEKIKLRNGLVVTVADYSLSNPGPGRYFTTEAAQAKAAGLELWSNCNSAGLTWDFGNVPYQPAPWQWKKRWDGLKAANAKWNLIGLRESHEYGWYPSFIAELEKEYMWEGGMGFDDYLAAVAERDFGKKNVQKALDAWRAWSRAAEAYVPTDENQYGPCRIGPAYPFNFFGKRLQTQGWKAPEDFPVTPGFRFSICHFDFELPIGGLGTAAIALDPNKEALEIELFESQVADYRLGVRLFREIAESLPDGHRDEAMRMAALGEYLMRACITTLNLKKGRIAWRRGDRKEVLALAREEYANAEAALRVVDADSRLGWLASSDYTGGRRQIEWKLAKLRSLIDSLSQTLR